jgi:hypothetical protein
MPVRPISAVNMMRWASKTSAQALLISLARFHAHYWQRGTLANELGWLSSPGSGAIADMLHSVVRDSIRDEIAKYKFKPKLLSHVGETEGDLFRGMDTPECQQATMPPTMTPCRQQLSSARWHSRLLRLALAARGFCTRPVTYTIRTALSIEQRRIHERYLLRYCREARREAGVSGTAGEYMLWLEHRWATLWCVLIGWLPCPPAAYGWELVVMGILRTFSAYEDTKIRQVIQDLN